MQSNESIRQYSTELSNLKKDVERYQNQIASLEKENYQLVYFFVIYIIYIESINRKSRKRKTRNPIKDPNNRKRNKRKNKEETKYNNFFARIWVTKTSKWFNRKRKTNWSFKLWIKI